MKEDLKIAWRNVWRNKRRSLITASSILFAVFFAIFMRGINLGFYGNVTDNIVKAYTGYIQIHADGYWDDKIIDNSFEYNKKLEDIVKNIKGVKLSIPRLESFALASTNDQTKGVMIIGTDLAKEKRMTKLDKKLVKGEYLKIGDNNAVIIAEGLANFFKLGINDTIVFMGQGFHGSSAAGKYFIKGIVKFPSPDLNNMMVYMNLETAQGLFEAQGRLTALAIDIDDKNNMLRIDKELIDKTKGMGYEIMTWDKMLAELDRLIKSEDSQSYMYIFILYIIIAFGVFGTVLMLTAERKREFGIMVSIGMQKIKLIRIVLMEIVFMGMLGVAGAMVISLPVVYYYHIHPIVLTGSYADSIRQYGFEPLMPLAWQLDYIITQVIVILCFLLLSTIYPISKIASMKVINALRN